MANENISQHLQNVPEVPFDAPSIPDENMLSDDQMKNNLNDLFSKVGQKIKSVKSNRFAVNAASSVNKREAVKVVFDKLISMGVDPSNLDQVRAFLEQLEQSDPDIYEMFASALDGILTDGPSMTQGPVM